MSDCVRDARLRTRKAAGECEVHRASSVCAVRALNVDRAAASKIMQAAGLGIQQRHVRLNLCAERPTRTGARDRVTRTLRRLPKRVWLTDVGACIERKGSPSPQGVG